MTYGGFGTLHGSFISCQCKLLIMELHYIMYFFYYKAPIFSYIALCQDLQLVYSLITSLPFPSKAREFHCSPFFNRKSRPLILIIISFIVNCSQRKRNKYYQLKTVRINLVKRIYWLLVRDMCPYKSPDLVIQIKV